jgi:hypothetical protein
MAKANRRRGRQSRARDRKLAGSPRRGAGSQTPREKERARGIDKVSLTIAILGVIVAGVAAVFAGLGYFNQADANQAANSAALQQYASKVSYTLQPSTSGKQELVITNRSAGAISGLGMSFPQPVQRCTTPCRLRAYEFATFSNIPACEVLTTSVLHEFSDPGIGPKSLAGSDLIFTDQSGRTWELFGGEHNRLIELSGYKPPAGVITLPAEGLTQASGCS